MKDTNIDHLFRHQFGKMVSILTKIFGFEHLETIEDAIQDTFIRAIKSWQNEMPENPEAWLTAAAKNRVIDIFRSVKAEKARSFSENPISIGMKIDELFLDHEIEDSQLRMIFAACHPKLDPKEQIAFALRTISGFSIKEIAAALLVKQETIKKRLQRARKMVAEEDLKFEIPNGENLPSRLDRVMEVIYVIFNEGFHPNKKELVIRKELCGEAMRLAKLVLKKEELRVQKFYALFALMCFHSARLDSKIDENNELISLSKQDRSKWYFPLVALGNDAMNKSVEGLTIFSSYHYEAAIAAEHLRAANFDSTNWEIIAKHYKELINLQENVYSKLNLAIVYLQMEELQKALRMFERINSKDLVQKEYLYFASLAEYHHLNKDKTQAIINIDFALSKLTNPAERKFLEEKRSIYAN